jgi:very-short-patch-repair endonuclease
VLRRAGWNVVRVTGHDVDSDPDDIVSDVRAMLELQRAARNSATA